MSAQLQNQELAANIIAGAKLIHKNNDQAKLVEAAVSGKEVRTTEHGALVANTGKFTGRSASDKFIVNDANTADTVWWDNTNAMDGAHFDALMADMLDFAKGQDLHHQQLYAGADAAHRYQVDVFTPNAWHALFIRNLLIRPEAGDLGDFVANATIVHMPGFEADPAKHGSKTSTCIALDFTRNIVLICGTFYAGEMKKSVFSLFNYHAPADDIFPMHCSANLSKEGDTTLFFGLSGTGKTTLSTEPGRALIGDDEHGWSKTGVFNLEGGCYAKAINLTREGEPEIYAAAEKVGSVLENVVMDDKGVVDYADGSATENTRIAYPLDFIENRVESGTGPVPKNVVLMSADAFGVLPPIAKLTIEQAIYYFLSGYTAKVAGTERGVTEPQATFSACFGAPFMSRHPSEYGKLLAKRLGETNATCWLLNTGWTGGAYGTGQRMPLKSTRRMLDAALAGELDGQEFRTDPVFGFDVPTQIEGVDTTILNPVETWADKEAFAKQATHLVDLFEANFVKLGPAASALTSAGLSATRAA
jgi:phosphoenolpyruvate carboxykinase (ATP)